MSELLLGIDIGTGSSKGVLVSPDGQVTATATRSHTTSFPAPGYAEHDADTVWWADIRGLCGELLPRAGDGPAAVAVSGIGPCVLPVDAAGQPTRPAILYGIDTRATREIDELTERYGEEAILGRGGSPLTTQAVGPKLLWLQRHEPAVWSSTRRLLMASSFAVARLTGEYVLDHHSASQCDPLYDLTAGGWMEDWAAEIAPGLELPRLLWPGQVAGEVTPAAEAATGIAAGTPVAAGTIDAWAESIAAGVRAPGETMVMYGSTLFLVQVADRPVRHPKLWSTTGAFEGSYSLAAGMATSGSTIEWLARLAGECSVADLVAEAEAVGPGAGGLLALPYFAGERTPIFDADARGVICGLTLRHEGAHLCRALLEGIAFGVRHNLDAMADAGAPPRRLVAVGGGTEGAVLPQIVSSVVGRPQDVAAHAIGASYGDAYLAGHASGGIDETGEWAAISGSVEPDPACAQLYDDVYREYRALYPATRRTAHALAEVQRSVATTSPQPVEDRLISAGEKGGL